MSAVIDGFVERLADMPLSNTERAVAILFANHAAKPGIGLTPREIDDQLHERGFPRQNVSRLREALETDRRTAKIGADRFRIRATAVNDLEESYGSLLTARPVKRTSSVLPMVLVENTRGYIEKVAVQLNASYDQSLYDCCAVMCRRLLETLVIEVYEHRGRASELRGPDGNFKMFSGLLAHVENDTSLNLGRNTMAGLRDFKKLGDLSAHNRRFNANRDDIDRIRDGLRVAAEELIHLAEFNRSDRFR